MEPTYLSERPRPLALGDDVPGELGMRWSVGPDGSVTCQWRRVPPVSSATTNELRPAPTDLSLAS
jgi:hypothetical protein